VASCADAPRDPVALLVAPEARAALEVGSALPALPELIQRSSPAGAPGTALAQAQALWAAAGVEADRGKAAELRESAYALAAPELAARMDSAALAGTQARLERWIELASGALRQAELRDLSAAMTDARDLLAAARAAGARGDRSTAIVQTLRASDRLAETTPRAVAARLAAEDEAALAGLRRLAGRPSGEEARRGLERIDRLVSGAREALAAGRYELAIRRAFYARQLLAAEGALAGG
jgi:hypothetical protein